MSLRSASRGRTDLWIAGVLLTLILGITSAGSFVHDEASTDRPSISDGGGSRIDDSSNAPAGSISGRETLERAFADAGADGDPSSLEVAVDVAIQFFRDAVVAAPQYAAYLECIASQGLPESCQSHLDSAMFVAIYRGYFRALDDDQFGIAAFVLSLGPEVASRAWTRLFAQSEDVVERVGLLAIRTRDMELRGQPIPDEVALPYSAGESIPESTLLLDMVADDPRPRSPERAHVLAERALQSSDVRLRERAIRALGHPSSAEELRGVLSQINGDVELVASLRIPLAMALHRCGGGCQDIIDTYLGSSAPELQELRFMLQRRTE